MLWWVPLRVSPFSAAHVAVAVVGSRLPGIFRLRSRSRRSSLEPPATACACAAAAAANWKNFPRTLDLRLWESRGTLVGLDLGRVRFQPRTGSSVPGPGLRAMPLTLSFLSISCREKIDEIVSSAHGKGHFAVLLHSHRFRSVTR